MQPEVWKDIPGESLHYQASSHGRIRRVDSPIEKNRIISQLLQRGQATEYMRVNIRQAVRSSLMKFKPVHRLVLMAFKGMAPEGKPCACHIDGNSLNSTPENLKWGSHKENIQDALDIGSFAFGERGGNAKLTNEQAIEIYTSKKQTKFLVKEYGISRGTVKSIRAGRTWVRITDALNP